MKYNSIDEYTLRAVVDCFHYKRVEPGVYIYHEADNAKHYFGIIKGRVSIRYKKKRARSENDDNNKDFSRIVSSSLFGAKLQSIVSKDTCVTDDNKLKELEKDGITFLSSMRTKYEQQITSERKAVFTNEYNAGRKTSIIKRLYAKLHQEYEEEITQLTNGMCFGNWALLYDSQKKSSAVAIEETDLFYIKQDDFDSNFSRSIHKAETDRKCFLQNIFSCFNKMPKHKFEECYRKFQINFYKKNEIIYKEGDSSGYLYVVYQGECFLKRDITLPYIFDKHKINYNHIKELNKDSIKDDKINNNYNDNPSIHNENPQNINLKNFHNILKLHKGGIAGLETAAGIPKLNHTLVTATDFTVVLKIDINDFNEFKTEVCNFLISIYIEKEIIIENYVKSHRVVKKAMKIHYRNFSENVNRNNKDFNLAAQKSKDNDKQREIEKTINIMRRTNAELKNETKSMNSLRFNKVEVVIKNKNLKKSFKSIDKIVKFKCNDNKIVPRININKKIASQQHDSSFVSLKNYNSNLNSINAYNKSNTNLYNFNRKTPCTMPISPVNKEKTNCFSFLRPLSLRKNKIFQNNKTLYTYNSGKFNLPMMVSLSSNNK
jgi:CRP-like cAMP-binding protein